MVLALSFANGDFAGAADLQKRVLVLYSTRRDAQIVNVGERELPRILERAVGAVDYYAEYIDQSRFQDPLYQSAFRDFLRLKYKATRFDLVIAVQDTALEFIGDARNELFSDTPIVFSANASSGRRFERSTGVVATLDLRGTLELALQLQPEIKRVFVVTGAERSDKAYEREARAQLRSFESRLTMTYLAGLATKELEARVATLPKGSIIYYLLVNRDSAGRNIHPLEYVDRLAAVASAPIYSWVDSTMDHGIIGGSLKDQKAQIEAVGGLAVRVLSGERPEDIPVSAVNLNVPQVDWRHLRRWGISEARVPAGTLIRFKQPSAWEQYKGYILGGVALLLAQLALIAGLLVQGRRRRQAEDQVRGSQDELRASYERIRDLGSRLLHAQDTERSRIARDLHDDIGQQLAILAVDLELLNGAVRPGREELVGETVHRAQSIAKGVHDLSRRLHPAKLRLVGLVAALHALQRELSRPGIEISFTHDNVPSIVPSDLTLCLYRVVQESLQNALKYSRAHEVSVHLRGESEALRLTVVDNGVGFDVDSAWGRGLGLISMGERLEAAGGTLEIRSKPGAGTRLDVRVPLSAAPSAHVAAG